MINAIVTHDNQFSGESGRDSGGARTRNEDRPETTDMFAYKERMHSVILLQIERKWKVCSTLEARREASE